MFAEGEEQLLDMMCARKNYMRAEMLCRRTLAKRVQQFGTKVGGWPPGLW